MRILLLLLLITPIFTLYETSTLVHVLESSTFRETVMLSKDPWFLLFGHDSSEASANFAPEYEKAAKYRIILIQKFILEKNSFCIYKTGLS